MNKNKFGRVYFGILGVVTLFFGIMDLVATLRGESITWGILEIPGDIFPGGWGGLIVLFAGLFYLAGIRNFFQIHQFSKVVMGSILVWIMAGCDIFAWITESIPGGEEGPWLNPWGNFLGTFAPPYTPAIFLLPFSLVVIYFIYQRRRT